MSSLSSLIIECPSDPRSERANNLRAMVSIAILMLIALIGLIMVMHAIDTTVNSLLKELFQGMMSSGAATHTSPTS